MKRLITIVCFLLLTFAISDNFAQDRGTGLGIIVGEPTGISVKNWVSRTVAFHAAAAWSFADEDALHLHVDYVYHNFDLFSPEIGDLALYYGIGGRVKFADDSRLGIRFPVGLDYMFEDQPFDLFVELIPILELAPATDFSLNGALGFRFFF